MDVEVQLGGDRSRSRDTHVVYPSSNLLVMTAAKAVNQDHYTGRTAVQVGFSDIF